MSNKLTFDEYLRYSKEADKSAEKLGGVNSFVEGANNLQEKLNNNDQINDNSSNSSKNL